MSKKNMQYFHFRKECVDFFFDLKTIFTHVKSNIEKRTLSFVSSYGD